jgi:hypothetical protein
VKKLIIIFLGLVSVAYGEAILFNPPTGNITAIEPEATQFDATRILGSKVYTDVDWTVLSIGRGTDCWNYVEYVWTNEVEQVITNINKVVKGNISEVSDFINSRLVWEQTEAVRIATVEGLKSNVWTIAEKYSVTSSPLNWFLLSAAIKQAATTNSAAVADGTELNSLALFLKEWGQNLYAITK